MEPNVDVKNNTDVYIKGTAWTVTQNEILLAGGEAGLEKIKVALAEADRQSLFNRTIMQISWVHFDPYIRYLFLADKILGGGDDKMLEAMVQKCVDVQFSGVYKIFMKLMTVEFLVNGIPRMWRQQFNRGEASVKWLGSKHFVVIIRDFPVVPGHEKLLMPYHFKAMQIVGCKNVKGEHRHTFQNKVAVCEFEYRWD